MVGSNPASVNVINDDIIAIKDAILYMSDNRLRYPNELAVDDAIAKSAIDKAQVIYDFCMNLPCAKSF